MARPLPGCSITETMFSGAICFSAIALFSDASSAFTTISFRACEFFILLSFFPPFLGCDPCGISAGSGDIEAVGVHHLGPGRHEVLYELLLGVRARVDLREGAELRVRTEDQVDAGAGPL